MGIPICGACRRPIEERVVTALGKHWHVEVRIEYKKNFHLLPAYLKCEFSFHILAFCMCQM